MQEQNRDGRQFYRPPLFANSHAADYIQPLENLSTRRESIARIQAQAVIEGDGRSGPGLVKRESRVRYACGMRRVVPAFKRRDWRSPFT